jgi:hypothetical protein
VRIGAGAAAAPMATKGDEVTSALLEMAKAFSQPPPLSDFGTTPAHNPWSSAPAPVPAPEPESEAGLPALGLAAGIPAPVVGADAGSNEVMMDAELQAAFDARMPVPIDSIVGSSSSSSTAPSPSPHPHVDAPVDAEALMASAATATEEQAGGETSRLPPCIHARQPMPQGRLAIRAAKLAEAQARAEARAAARMARPNAVGDGAAAGAALHPPPSIGGGSASGFEELDERREAVNRETIGALSACTAPEHGVDVLVGMGARLRNLASSVGPSLEVEVKAAVTRVVEDGVRLAMQEPSRVLARASAHPPRLLSCLRWCE